MAAAAVGGPAAQAPAQPPPPVPLTFHVKNFGVDSATCGPSTSPCRSIAQAIANAPFVASPIRLRPRIRVGPGRYPGLASCSSVILVDKPVSI